MAAPGATGCCAGPARSTTRSRSASRAATSRRGR
jgi:hypothetical protein